MTQPQFPAGHCCLDATPNFTYNNNTWARSTTLLFVEQPIGTGFSYGNAFPEDEHDVATDLDAFMQNFYKVFPRFKPYDFFVMGESYAGMFVPTVARHFHFENKKAIANEDESRILIPIKGASLGNGWIDAKIQGPAVIDYSWWHGLIDKPTRDSLHVAWENCMLIRDGKAGKDQTLSPPFHPFNIVDDCGIMWGVLKGAEYPNAYDVTTWDPNVDQITFASEVFYNNPFVRNALHAPGDIVWHGCRQGGGRRLAEAGPHQMHRQLYMDNERPLSVVPYIADLVDDGIPVIVYNGDRDMTTNMVGTELALNSMEWKGQASWPDAPRGLWLVDGHQAGWSKEYGNLTFLTVYNSGHMVPYNMPVPAHDLLKRLLTHSTFIDLESAQVRVEPFAKIKTLEKDTHSSHHSKSTHRSKYDAAVVEGVPQMAGASTLTTGIHWETASVALLSMVLGFVLALLSARRTSRGYQRVPDACAADQ